jgi:ParB family chromosome partitioning protein
LEQSSNHKGQSVFLPNDTCQYELIAGERRLRAAKMLGMCHVPCIIVEVDDAISAELALVENMLRENLNMFEQAAAFAHLSEKYNLTQEEIAAKMSLSQSAVANKIRLLKLSEDERQMILESDLTERHARALLRIPDDLIRSECLQTIIERKLNVSETDKYITCLLSQSPEPPKTQDLPRPSPEKLCTNIYKFINRMQVASGNYLIVNRRSDDKNVVITLTVRR